MASQYLTHMVGWRLDSPLQTSRYFDNATLSCIIIVHVMSSSLSLCACVCTGHAASESYSGHGHRGSQSAGLQRSQTEGLRSAVHQRGCYGQVL